MNAKDFFVHDFFVPSNLNSIKGHWDKLTEIVPKYGCFPIPGKSYLRIKEKKMMEAKNLFANSRVNVSSEGK